MLELKEIDKIMDYLDESKWHLNRVISCRTLYQADYQGMRQLIAQIDSINTDALMKEAIVLRKLKSNIGKLVVNLSKR